MSKGAPGQALKRRAKTFPAWEVGEEGGGAHTRAIVMKLGLLRQGLEMFGCCEPKDRQIQICLAMLQDDCRWRATDLPTSVGGA